MIGKNIMFYTDNMALVSIINDQTSRDKQVMRLIRLLVLYCLKFDIYFQSVHIMGKRNIVADRLSRGKMREFRQLAPWVNQAQAIVPREMLPENLKSMLCT